ncbi:uncharacterized protein LOC111712727 [Eurytemora carolleeae]|uniref:uncharacterized protein LOC111712727 n=1 Tax=Eurytemora carolleeae TaxID=1294199 RepID=UPI000C75CE25|nr:uncharacterized protein LOC111712727 [Eurytemora carolleeae]|eukprot:XP_023343198.1 uncharacterized protein LOC111712727 [Eurytemora affinis]
MINNQFIMIYQPRVMFLSVCFLFITQGMCKSFLIETIDDPEPFEPYEAPAVPYGADSPSADVSAAASKGKRGNGTDYQLIPRFTLPPLQTKFGTNPPPTINPNDAVFTFLRD